MTARRFTAVAWDIDGTLVDSEPLHHRALVAATAGFGVDLRDLPDQAFRGIHMKDVWTMLRPRLPADLDEAVWLAAINAHYVGHRHELMPIPGARETISRLAAAGVPQACVSNSSRSVVDANIDALGIADRIAFSISLDDVVAGKPDPEPYARAVARLGVTPAATVAVEDSGSGIRSARAAGLYVVGFVDGLASAGSADIHPLVGSADAHLLVGSADAHPLVGSADIVPQVGSADFVPVVGYASRGGRIEGCDRVIDRLSDLLDLIGV